MSEIPKGRWIYMIPAENMPVNTGPTFNKTFLAPLIIFILGVVILFLSVLF